jgi:Ala-tRNA(Pro) deacylase
MEGGVAMNVQEFLKEKGIGFEVVPHEQVFTAQEVAAAEHETGHHFAKTVIAKGGDDAVMLVLPASRHVDFEKVSKLVGKEVRMATEGEMKKLFPDCEVGAEPPFGSQYGVPTYVDTSLEQCSDIVFRAGTHDKTVKMSYTEYKKLEKPKVAGFAIMED